MWSAPGYFTKNFNIYSSPFHYDIINSGIGINNYFALLQNIQKNNKGDSCDLWSNFKTDLLFADTTMTILNNMSPAIGRADDGTNIGYYQGASVNNKNKTASRLRSVNSLYYYSNAMNSRPVIVLSLRNTGHVLMSVFNINGVLIATLINRNLLSGISQIPLNATTFTPGTYICKFKSGSDYLATKIVIVK